MIRVMYGKCRLIVLLLICLSSVALAQKKLNVCIAGLSHERVTDMLDQYKNGCINLIGIAEPDKSLQKKYQSQYHIADTLFYTDLQKMLAVKEPDVMLAYNEVSKHLDVVKACAPLGILVMVEKPLAATLDQAEQMEMLVEKYHNRILTNFETTWYPSYQEVYNAINQDSIGSIKKIVVNAGQAGSKKAVDGKIYLSSLIASSVDGSSALNDFGCYGADIMTWFMRGLKPIAITVLTRNTKPGIVTEADGDANIILEYPGVTGLIKTSWNEPAHQLEVFGQKGDLHTLNNTVMVTHSNTNQTNTRQVTPIKAPLNDPVAYITAVLQNKVSNDDRSSLRYNVMVMEILEAAKRSVRENRRIAL